MAASLLRLNLDYFWNGLTSNSRWPLPKCHINLSFLPYTSISSFILDLFTCLGVGKNLIPFEKREILSLERGWLDKLITLALTKFPSYILLRIVALLSWTSLSRKSSSELSLNLLEDDKLGLSFLKTFHQPAV